MQTVKLIQDVDINEFIDFLKSELNSADPASMNMYDINWETKSHTLLYKLFIEKIYDTGIFHVVFDNNTIIGCSGAYISTFNSELGLLGSRTWINKEYRNLQIPRELLLPAQKQWAIDNKLKAIALTFNEYNKNLINTFNRIRIGEHRSPRDIHHIFYNGMQEVPFPVNIQYTKQYVIYELLDNSWDFDWESIKFNSDKF